MKYLYNTTRFVQYIDSPLTKYGLRLLTVYSMQTYHLTKGISVHGLRVLKPWVSPISEFYNLYPSFLFHSVLKILTVKANFQYLTLNLILSSLRRVEPPGLEPGISACKAEVLANYTMTPNTVLSCYRNRKTFSLTIEQSI